MKSSTLLIPSLAGYAIALANTTDQCAPTFPAHCPSPIACPNTTLGICPTDFTIRGPPLIPVHEFTRAPTGLAVDHAETVYLTYPRNSGATPSNVVRCTNFTAEEPWPNAAIQNCTTDQDPSTCFINVQNVVLDSQNVLWAVDSGIPADSTTKQATPGGAKIMGFNLSDSNKLVRTYTIPTPLLHDGANANDVRINNTQGTGGFAFITDESKYGSLFAIDLATGAVARRLFNTSVVRADDKYVGSYNGAPVYSWNGTERQFTSTGSDGIALQSGNVYWGVLASRRFYYVPQSVLTDFEATDEAVLDAVVFPGQLGSEQAGFTADDLGRLYMMASEQNAIYYVDTVQADVCEEVNGTPAGGTGLVAPENYVVKTLVRSGLIQHADSAAILNGWLYFCTNQLELSPTFSYNNTDNRRGPFRSYKLYIGAGPAV